MGLLCYHSWISVHGKEGKRFLFCTCTLIKPLTSLNCSIPSCLVFPPGIWLLEKPVPELHTLTFCVPLQWNLPFVGLIPPFGGEVKNLLHNEPWDCPLPGNGAALVSSSPCLSSICWVCMLKLGACEFSCTCLELIHHRLRFGFSLSLINFSVSHPDSLFHTHLWPLKPFLWCNSNPSCSVQVFSLPVLPVQLSALGVLVWCGAVQEGIRQGKVRALSGIQTGRLLPPPCQVWEGRNVNP